MTTIGDRLKKARENKMLSQIQVYKDTGIHNKTLSGYERGVSQPDLETIVLLADYYDVSIEYLLSDKRINFNKGSKNHGSKVITPYEESKIDANCKIMEDILSLSPENQQEVHKLVKLYKIKEEYEKKTNQK